MGYSGENRVMPDPKTMQKAMEDFKAGRSQTAEEILQEIHSKNRRKKMAQYIVIALLFVLASSATAIKGPNLENCLTFGLVVGLASGLGYILGKIEKY